MISKDVFEQRLNGLSRIAEVVNAFNSERIQERVFEILIADLQARPSTHPFSIDGDGFSPKGPDAINASDREQHTNERQQVADNGEVIAKPAVPAPLVAESQRSYSMEISRGNKGLMVFLVDQSSAMAEQLGTAGKRKTEVVAEMIDAWLQNMSIRASSSEGVKDWFDVAVVGYHTDLASEPMVGSAFAGELAGKQLVSIADVAANPARITRKMMEFHDEDSGEMIKMDVEAPVWIEPVAEGGRPTCAALHKVYELVDAWIVEHPHSFPPLVFHFAGAESQDGDAVAYADSVRELATDDGSVLLFNCYLSSVDCDSLLFPAVESALPDELSRTLFRMSSVMPDVFRDSAKAEGLALERGARCMALNCDMLSVLKFLDMGTRVVRRLR